MHCLWMYRDRRNSDGVGRIIHIANDHGGTTNKVFLQWILLDGYFVQSAAALPIFIWRSCGMHTEMKSIYAVWENCIKDMNGIEVPAGTNFEVKCLTDLIKYL